MVEVDANDYIELLKMKHKQEEDRIRDHYCKLVDELSKKLSNNIVVMAQFILDIPEDIREAMDAEGKIIWCPELTRVKKEIEEERKKHGVVTE